MKRIVILLIGVFMFAGLNAQNSKVVSAYNYLRNGQLDKAKEAIDAASVHIKTKDAAKTWFYRGNIYLAIQVSEEEKYNNLDPNALIEAYDSYQKAISIDDKVINTNLRPSTPMQGLYFCGDQFYNVGVKLYNNKKYAEATESFVTAVKSNNIFGKTDSLAMFNAALCAELAEKPEIAKKYYIQLLKLNYTKPTIYTSLAGIYKSEDNSEKEIEIIEKGRKTFPHDFNLISAETNYHLSAGNSEKALELLNIAIEKDPENQTLYFAIGSNYNSIVDDTAKTVEERANGFIEAEKSYIKAIEIDSAYFDPIYNLGALYFNEGIKIFEVADGISDFELYAVEKEKYDAMWAKALPYLERALEIDGENLNTLISLKQLYARTNQPEKLKKVNEKLKEVQGQ
ncbi:MAG: hypothetical protein K8S00_01570 [Bacteroidales bacterium]|nr:hypothetical protein [Bacteroidales bacterium]